MSYRSSTAAAVTVGRLVSIAEADRSLGSHARARSACVTRAHTQLSSYNGQQETNSILLGLQAWRLLRIIANLVVHSVYMCAIAVVLRMKR
jgi:hypothetical protein